MGNDLNLLHRDIFVEVNVGLILRLFIVKFSGEIIRNNTVIINIVFIINTNILNNIKSNNVSIVTNDIIIILKNI